MIAMNLSYPIPGVVNLLGSLVNVPKCFFGVLVRRASSLLAMTDIFGTCFFKDQ
jgi:hypothetical protein